MIAQARAAASAAYQEKARSRRAFEALLRPAVRRIQTFAATTDVQRGSLGITSPDPGSAPIGTPSTRPVVRVECGQRLQRLVSVGKGAAAKLTRARVLLQADQSGQGPGRTDARIAEGLGVTPQTIENIRRRLRHI